VHFKHMTELKLVEIKKFGLITSASVIIVADMAIMSIMSAEIST